ncbi:MAG: RibD family protein [Leptolyngbya sp. SIO4C5]|nr:RibD family protein [Leptolyngbya sp. SIO4C5]
MSADGKIADAARSPARFPSGRDQAHLEVQVAAMDAVLFGAGTLRAYGTSLPVKLPRLLEQRQQRGLPPQPVHIVCSASGNLDPQWRFFQQPLPRWLLTTPCGAQHWGKQPGFEQQIVISPVAKQSVTDQIDWAIAFEQLQARGIEKLGILGGGTLVESLLQGGHIDELRLTICPLLLGGAQSPTPVEGAGFLAEIAPRLSLISCQPVADEIFLHYRVETSPRSRKN